MKYEMVVVIGMFAITFTGRTATGTAVGMATGTTWLIPTRTVEWLSPLGL